MKLVFSGKVEFYDYTNVAIGGRKVVPEIARTFGRHGTWPSGPQPRVTIALIDRDTLARIEVEGELWACEGTRGYSEYTPGDPEELEVGSHNVMDVLWKYAQEGRDVVLVAADEPVNILEVLECQPTLG